jgi:hypothetical protein
MLAAHNKLARTWYDLLTSSTDDGTNECVGNQSFGATIVRQVYKGTEQNLCDEVGEEMDWWLSMADPLYEL